MKHKGVEIFLPELNMSLESLRLHLLSNYNIKLEQMNHKMQTGGTADSAMSNDPMIGGTMASSMARGGKISVGDFVKVKPMYGNIYGEVTFSNDNIIVIKNSMGKTFMFHPQDLIKSMGKGGNIEMGDMVNITDDKSMFTGKSGVVLSQLTPKTVIVKILVDGNERNVVVRKSGLVKIDTLEEGGIMTADEVYSYDTQDSEFMAEGGGVGNNQLNLVFSRRDVFEKAKDFYENESSFYPAQVNDEFRTFVFDIENNEADVTEYYLDQELQETDLDGYYFELADKYGKGGGVGKFFSKAKELGKKGYEKSKAYTKGKVKEQKRKIAVDVINDTDNRTSGKANKDTLDKARQLVIRNYSKGGSISDLTQEDKDNKISQELALFKRGDIVHLPQKKYGLEQYVMISGVKKTGRGGWHYKYKDGYLYGGNESLLFTDGVKKVDINDPKVRKAIFDSNYKDTKRILKDQEKNDPEQIRKRPADKDKLGEILLEAQSKVYKEMTGDNYSKGGSVSDLESQINALYSKSGFINTDFNWRLKLLEMLQDQSGEAYDIYQKLSKQQKDDVLQEQFEIDNDMGSDGDGNIKTSKENLKIMLSDANNGKKYAEGGATPTQKRKISKVMREWKEGELNIGNSDKKVKSQKQAVAIALSQAGLSKKEEGGKMMGWKHKRK